MEDGQALICNVRRTLVNLLPRCGLFFQAQPASPGCVDDLQRSEHEPLLLSSTLDNADLSKTLLDHVYAAFPMLFVCALLPILIFLLRREARRLNVFIVTSEPQAKRESSPAVSSDTNPAELANATGEDAISANGTAGEARSGANTADIINAACDEAAEVPCNAMGTAAEANGDTEDVIKFKRNVPHESGRVCAGEGKTIVGADKVDESKKISSNRDAARKREQIIAEVTAMDEELNEFVGAVEKIVLRARLFSMQVKSLVEEITED